MIRRSNVENEDKRFCTVGTFALMKSTEINEIEFQNENCFGSSFEFKKL